MANIYTPMGPQESLMMTETPEEVTLIIKAANQSVSDLKIESHLDKTVLHIKNEIRDAHPIKPPVSEQRLIYSGQLLLDNLTLKTVLRHPSENNSFTIHLVCSTPRQLISNKKSPEPSKKSALPSAPLVNENNAILQEGPSNAEGLRRRLVASTDSSNTNGQQPATVPIDPSTVYPHFSMIQPSLQFSADPIQQMAAMQQMYAHYMASYMQYMQSGTVQSLNFQQEGTFSASTGPSPPLIGIPQPNVNVDNQNQQNPLPQLNNEQVQNNANPLAPQPNGPLRMNAQGGVGEEEEDGAPRDWLDYIYFGSRMIVLLCVVYFYSTVTRLMLVVLSCMFIYMYQAGWVRALLGWGEQRIEDQERQRVVRLLVREQQRREQQQQPRNDDVIEEPVLQGGDYENPARRIEGTNENEGAVLEGENRLENGGERDYRELEGGEAVQNVVEGQPSIGHPIMEDLPPQPSLLALSWTFLTSFFTSLIPEQHQIV